MLTVPQALTDSHRTGLGDTRWLAELPTLAATMLHRWDLRPDGPARHGMIALALPVTGPRGPAVLKLQPITDDTTAEPLGLHLWNGDGTVRLLDHDPGTGSMLLERLHPRSLADLDDDTHALHLLGALLARLTRTPAPPGLRHLADIGAAMLTRTPHATGHLTHPDERALLHRCAAALTDVLPEPGDRLLHWDLHYDNVLAADREPWLAIDPQPLAGHPAFELLPALDNRWDDITSTGDIPRAVRRRFHALTEHLDLERDRATAWTLARVLQNCLWDIDDGATALAPTQRAIAEALISGR
ncbi:aminoglycoside phosphotransferase family protein [Saccharopolyspora cebuensis]|uniref:aminoglycoside phosphotransferase family protein n=1 Tax=Saccharopolyspora cebuensis TaxID=418759 RepID=UPI003381DA08